MRADSNDAVAHYNVALGYWSEEEYDDAEGALSEAISLDRRFALAYLARSYLRVASLRWGEEVAFDLWLDTDPDVAAALEALGGGI